MTDLNANSARRRVLSGMRPTGKLHLGNYMGALKNWVDLQNATHPDGSPMYECYFFIADYHALTTDYADTSRIQENTMEVALDFLSAGLDPSKCTIFVQSHVPQHAELHLLLSMITPLSWLERVPSYKDQQEQLKQKDLNTYGFLGYPLLQSADILVYRPDFVPVGQDQVAHVELTREVARRFNSMYRAHVDPLALRAANSIRPTSIDPEILLEPDVLLTPTPKLPGLDGRKMSKSYGNTIMLTDAPGVVRSKLEGMNNGGQRFVQGDPGDPDACPVGDMHQIFSSQEINLQIQRGCREASISCVFCKHLAANSVTGVLTPIQAKRSELEMNLESVGRDLEQGAKRAAIRARNTMKSVRQVMGLDRNVANIHIESSVRRFFGNTNIPVIHDLKKHADLSSTSRDVRAAFLRAYWMEKVIPREIVLKEDSERVFITSGKKRVHISTSLEIETNEWRFDAKPKSYEVIVLLCLSKDLQLRDFVIPQKVYVQEWSSFKKSHAKDAEIHFTVSQSEEKFFFQIDGSQPIDISDYQSKYESMR